MFITPYFGGCKYTNKFLFINKIIVFQHFALLITFSDLLQASTSAPHDCAQITPVATMFTTPNLSPAPLAHTPPPAPIELSKVFPVFDSSLTIKRAFLCAA